MNHEAVKLEDRASQQDHLIVAMEQNQVLDTAQTLLSDQLVTIAGSAPIVRLAISAAILFAD
jgi:hypothetical protein